MADEVDLRRVEEVMLATAHGNDLGPTTWAERAVATRFIAEMVRNWQRAGALPCTQDPLDLTPTDVQDQYRRWSALLQLFQDPSVPWQEGQTLGSLLKTCGDRLPLVQAALRKAGIELPEEWSRPVDEA